MILKMCTYQRICGQVIISLFDYWNVQKANKAVKDFPCISKIIRGNDETWLFEWSNMKLVSRKMLQKQNYVQSDEM